MLGPKIIIVLFVIAVIGAILFIAKSGVVSKLESISNLFPYSTSTASTSTSGSSTSTAAKSASLPWYLQPSSPSPESNGQQQLPWYLQGGSSGGNGSPLGQATVSPSDIPTGFTASDISPYFHQVRLSRVSAGYSYNSSGQVSLSANFSGSGAVDVTSWTIKANRGGQAIGTAVDVYEPAGANPEGDIYLASGDVLNIYIGTYSVGPNLRLNKCIGYLANSFKYAPSLPSDCPGLDKSGTYGFTGQCQNYISSLGSCDLPSSNPPVPQNDYGCLAFLNSINYRGCFDKHRGDADFLSHEWRMWVNGRFLDVDHDTVELLDRQGKLVDIYKY